MTSQKRPDRRLSGKHVVWFEETNQWVAFEKPAYKIFKWRNKGKSKNAIRRKTEKKYGLTSKEAKRFVNEVTEWLDMLTHPSGSDNAHSKNVKCSEDPLIRNYKIEGRSIRVCYFHQKLESYFHPPIAHFEEPGILKPDSVLELCASKEGFSLICNDNESTFYDTVAELKHGFNICLMQIVHEVNANDWLTWIHGSSVEKAGKAAIFTSPSGSGKSTIAALLQSRNFRILADDMVFLERNSSKIYPVPTALSIKNGALKTVADILKNPGMQKHPLHQIGERKMAFIPPLQETGGLSKPVHARYLIFIQYDRNTELSIRKLSEFDAFQRLHQNAWMNGTAESATAFIEWFVKLEYYELIYSDTKQALDLIDELFLENL